MNQERTIPLIIEQKITKVSGEIGVKKYKRCELLGIGANSKCYKCINLESLEEFAIKAIEKTNLEENGQKEKVLSEINIHKTLYHENIVKFYTVFEDREFVYFVIEICENKTLLEYMDKKNNNSINNSRKFITQIIKAVEYMHQNQIIHRDLKLANIFLDQNNQIKVGDFGEATKLEFADEKKISVCGTLNYLAPEIVSGPFGHSYEVDYWAIGVISFALLFGKSPFQSKTENETLERIKQCKYEFPNVAVPSEAKDFIRKILVCDSKKRMNLQEMLEHPFITNSKIIKETNQNSFLQKILSSKIFQSSSCQVSSGSLLVKSKSSENFKKCVALRSALSPKDEQKTATSFTKSESIQQQLFSFVDCFIDLSKKYGLGYLINNNTYGILFNDGSVISSDEKKRTVFFVRNPKKNPNSVEEYRTENLPKDRDFQKKYLLLDSFIGLLKIESLKKSRILKEVVGPYEKFVYVKEWWRNSQAMMFNLSSNKFQVSFVDGSQTLFDSLKQSIVIKSKDGQERFFEKIEDALLSSEAEFKKKYLYTKEILLSIQRKKNDITSNIN